ncbi:MAG: YHS domain-containing protein [Candidatus Cryosericum sp.]|nr:YHS domain-containing protein [bacterium]
MTKHIDPVCGMVVKEGTGKPTLEYKGITYYFCGDHCKDAFEKDPEKYLALKPGDRHMDMGH